MQHTTHTNTAPARPAQAAGAVRRTSARYKISRCSRSAR